MTRPLTIFWFRQDLRLSDNPGLSAAVEAGRVLPIYILEDECPGQWRMGAASRWWLHHSLKALDNSLDGRLKLFHGSAAAILPDVIARTGASAVFWNRCYEPWRIERDKQIKKTLQDKGVEVQSYNGSLLWEPWEVLKSDGTPYRVFTPYFRKGCLAKPAPRKPLPQTQDIDISADEIDGVELTELSLLAEHSWHEKLCAHWDIGEEGAKKALGQFLENGLEGYKEGRDFPARNQCSRLSPHLHFGEISPHQVWHNALSTGVARQCEADTDHFLSELAWREFSYYLLYHFPRLPENCFVEKFERFSWTRDADSFNAWKWGRTGYPMVDAGMRELWETGSMHNRVRMIVASFLVKNQLVDWRLGQEWFWDCLVDADLASNSFGWQWVAGCGADAAPYFRIFNPVTQGRKFDPDGHYVRRFIPEIAGLPDRYLHAPWEASKDVLDKAGVQLGENYPEPVVELKSSRQKALAAFERLKSSQR